MPEWDDAEDQYDAAAIERARKKLEAIRAGKVRLQPAGRFRNIGAGVFLALLGGLLVWAGFATWDPVREPNAEMTLLVFFLLASPFLLGALWCFVGTKPNTPRKALKLFYKALARGKYGYARKLVVPSDFDDFPRYMPDLPGLGAPNRDPIRFQRQGFKSFWQRAIRYHSSPVVQVRVSNVRVDEPAPDVAVVHHDVRFTMNTQLWYLLILIALLIALIVVYATNKNARDSLAKILVRVDDEWHLLNGEWQGPEEERLDWVS